MRKTVLLLGLICVLPLSAAPKKKKPEKPAQALKRVAKTFAKLKSYQAEVAVQGGMAKGHNHMISPTVNSSYTMQRLGRVTRLDGPLLGFRLKGKIDGAAKVNQTWKKLLTPKEGRAMTRLCQPPEALIAEALRLKRNARYVDNPSSSTGPGEILASVSDDSDDSGTRTDKANKRGSSGADDDELGPQPRHIVIEAEGTVAVQHFERVLSSGCLLTGG